MKYLSKTVVVLSFVSLFNDISSELLYPILPVYLNKIGFSVVLIGILEGVAEATAGLSKGYFGNLSDVNGKRLPFVRFGYALSAISKPMMGIFAYPFWVFISRTFDKFGKGIRTGARDAMLSDESTRETKGKVFGFHRSMDTLGAVIGPTIGLIYLIFYPDDYKTLFLIAFFPGVVTIFLTFLIKEKTIPPNNNKSRIHIFSFLKYWKDSPIEYRRLVSGLLLFALFNSSDVFLLLKAKESGLSDQYVIGFYIFFNLIYALTSFPIGILADKIGLKKIFICALLIFSAVYVGMAMTNELEIFTILFILYGIYAAASEGISKALISNIVNRKDVATAIGTYSGFQSICAMIASAMTGLIWFNFGAPAAFICTAAISLIVAIYFIRAKI